MPVETQMMNRKKPFHKAQPYVMSFLSGCIASLSLPPAYITPAFLIFGWVLYASATAARWQSALLHIALGAYGWFIISLYWISHSLLIGEADYWFLIPLSFFGIPLIVTSFWVVFGTVGYLLCQTAAARLMMIIIALGVAEWAREFIATGFPWNAPGLVFLVSEPTSYFAAYLGQTGLNLLAFLLAGLGPFWILLPTDLRRISVIFTAFLLISMTAISWHYGRHHADMVLSDSYVRLVQPAIPQDEKWDYDKRASHVAKLVTLSRQPADKEIDLVIWPEVAFAGNYHAHEALFSDLVSQIARSHQAHQGKGHLLTGILRIDEAGDYYNSALLLSDDGDRQIYNKTHLVPFGEYVPWRFIPFIDAIAGPVDFSKGRDVRPLETESFGLILPLICYEAIFPQLTGQSTSRPELLVNVTNDAWFGQTAGPYQHLAQTQMTAASYGLPLVRVANTGISAVISPTGQIQASLALGQDGVLDAPIATSLRPTWFARFGWWPFFVISIILIFGVLRLDRIMEKRQ